MNKPNVVYYRNLAIKTHRDAGKTYAGYPYELHLDACARFGERFFYLLSEEDQAKTQKAIYLHDIIEDCAWTYNDVKKEAGTDVADIVFAVTNELGKNRKERAERTYPKTKKNNLAVFVKLCDRLANTSFGLYNTSPMRGTYAQEFAYFKEIVQTPGVWDDMWELLEAITNLI
jgi:(p)ppGpp synthase/HD superfamily hydrolase